MGGKVGNMLRATLGICALILLSGCATSLADSCGCAPTDCDACAPETCAPAPARCLQAQGPDGPKEGSYYYGVGGNVIPSIGLSLHGGKVLWRNNDIMGAVEAEIIGQFLDDEDLIDDGNPSSDPFVQLKAGIKTRNNPNGARHATFRTGLTYFHAGDDPNIVQDEGDYVGVYFEGGFETDLSDTLTVGPSISATIATQTDDFSVSVVPTLSWRMTWFPCGNGKACHKCREPGEVYIDIVGSVSPTLGGGIGLGQVFERNKDVTWSFETLANFQSLSDGTLLAESDGDFAQLRGGVKAAFNGCGFGRWTGRAGATFIRNTGDIDGFGAQGDYVGLYFGAGYEFDLNPYITMGPEIAVSIVDLEGLGDVDIEVLPQFFWHVIINL